MSGGVAWGGTVETVPTQSEVLDAARARERELDQRISRMRITFDSDVDAYAAR